MTLLGLLAIGLCLRVAISDLYARRVPNAWLLAACALALPWLLVSQLTATPQPLAAHLLGAVLGLLALLPFHLLRMMGAGDVKFFAVLGLLLGWQALLPAWIVASLAAGLHAGIVVASRLLAPRLPATLQAQHWQAHPALRDMQQARQGRTGAPYASYLALAAIGWLLVTTYGGAA
ncbi:A24 family peptidase [Stenotrophomonas sp. YAU14A_MKIMI4_1]|uniref:prepilin peptidase n=1 Tax=Stenotrophomonas sp. YAU14A_MKIMI4_1 TaxID=2072408 RepID=UPI000D54200B|nr:A24 family peptidase [Stenotrophomonas sp. YAU14A_MKIMI4_1]AWH29434.1 peptidase [Stenotrophomonas sp. YAU14A_MKIMI4_1]